jgi:FlaA1/EpsC-like NDP-sugar epimerase
LPAPEFSKTHFSGDICLACLAGTASSSSEIVISCFGLSAIASFVIRLETIDSARIFWGIALFLIIAAPVKTIVFLSYGMYRQYWANAGPIELALAGFACLMSGGLLTVIWFGVAALWPLSDIVLPRSIPFIDLLVTAALVLTSRFGLRAWYTLAVRRNHQHLSGKASTQKALIIGAGHTGFRVLEALRNASDHIMAVGFLDDDRAKIGTFIRGLKVLGTTHDLRAAAQEQHIDLVIIAIPSAPAGLIRQIVRVCQETGIQHRIMPSTYELVSGQISTSVLRPIVIDDLLRRAPVKLEIGDIQRQLEGRRILITGAGGTIGSELARQIARCKPERLLLLGHGENSLFAVESSIVGEFPLLPYTLLLVDVRHKQRMEAVFEQWQPDMIFHTAAHKHVPMLEANAVEAVTNNVAGTQNLVDLCNRFNVQRMVMISTDKAVKPTSVMGKSKRAAELLVINAAQSSPNRFAVVRFGNVLGSRGSVVPIFERQIAHGGPVTITDEAMTRFFMSIPEAVHLVLKASALTNYGPLFVLNMGDPVRIVDLAQDMIRLSGAEPGRDIEIRVVGPRPGEKLHEELFWDFEDHQPIEQEAIFALQPSSYRRYVTTEVSGLIQSLIRAAESGDDRATQSLLQEVAHAVCNGHLPGNGTNGKSLEATGSAQTAISENGQKP